MLCSQLLSLLCCVSWALGHPYQLDATRRQQSAAAAPALTSDNLTTLVEWDQNAVYVRGQRVLLYNAEFHAYRLPVPSLWLDIFQKLKSAGFSGVSFYTDWALLEGKPGDYSAEGIFALEPFFEAAQQAGIYIVARPGPYINAESSGGGFPGWLQRNTAVERTPDYLPLTENYVKNVATTIAKYQITNGGPVILFQPENEYTNSEGNVSPFPNKQYFADTEKMFRDAGIVVPFVSNDASPNGNFVPGSGLGAVDIYGHDSYPLGFDCANPTVWPAGALPTDFFALHEKQSPSTPYTISEFQGGSFDPWGGSGFEKCTILTGADFERVFYKNNYAAKVAIFNLYMGWGGTNWGNLGHPGGYTSYDYGAAIAEDRTVAREKYSEVKLQANFLHASPAYLQATGGNPAAGAYVNTADITTTRLTTNSTNFYVIRHSDYTSTSSTNYTLKVPTSHGTITVPQLTSTLALNGRDSKIHVTDYDVGGFNLLYSSFEIFTWKKYANRTVLVLYGDEGETHEAAFAGYSEASLFEGYVDHITAKNGSLVINWRITQHRVGILLGQNLFIYMVDRNSVYNYWVLDEPSGSSTPYIGTASSSLIVNGGYLLRNASVSGNMISMYGDINKTTDFEVLGGFPSNNTSLEFNGRRLNSSQYLASYEVVVATAEFTPPKYSLPDLSKASWRYLDSLPELRPTYDDSAWTNANHTTTNNTMLRPLKTPVSLSASDYGYNTGNLLFRGHFVASGNESALTMTTQGGTAFASAIWLNNTLVSTWPGNSVSSSYTHVATVPKLKAGSPYVLTVLLDHMGLDEDFAVGSDENKDPRGILAYTFGSNLTWKMTGNLGGEDYRDRTRGPLNEGGLYAERQGFHLPNPPTSTWGVGSPAQGINQPGVGFWTTSFNLAMPTGYDIPLSFQFTNTTTRHGAVTTANFRCQLYVNGYQYGKYVNNIGPQTAFPVPQGILNYNGPNTVALSLWGFDAAGNAVPSLELVPTAEIESGYGAVPNAPMPAYSPRAGTY